MAAWRIVMPFPAEYTPVRSRFRSKATGCSEYTRCRFASFIVRTARLTSKSWFVAWIPNGQLGALGVIVAKSSGESASFQHRVPDQHTEPKFAPAVVDAAIPTVRAAFSRRVRVFFDLPEDSFFHDRQQINASIPIDRTDNLTGMDSAGTGTLVAW